jgi:hypothetical protein
MLETWLQEGWMRWWVLRARTTAPGLGAASPTIAAPAARTSRHGDITLFEPLQNQSGPT